jgi:hypothetical protein
MSEAQRLWESAAMAQRLAEQQTTAALRAHLMETARDWRRMAEKAEAAEAAEARAQAALPDAPGASISPRAA